MTDFQQDTGAAMYIPGVGDARSFVSMAIDCTKMLRREVRLDKSARRTCGDILAYLREEKPQQDELFRYCWHLRLDPMAESPKAQTVLYTIMQFAQLDYGLRSGQVEVTDGTPRWVDRSV